jgi:hypothetical protein
MCRNFFILQSNGHPKWREVNLALPDLGRGWSYYPPTTRELQACIATRARTAPGQPTPPIPSSPACTQQERVLGLCR